MNSLCIDFPKNGISYNTLNFYLPSYSAISSTDQVDIDKEQSDSTMPIYSYNPFLNTFVAIDPLQRWFWEPEWLENELKVEEELKNGEYVEFDNFGDFLNSLKSL